MNISNFRQPGDLSIYPQKRGAGKIRLILALAAGGAVIVGVYTLLSPQDEINLEPPLSQISDRPIIRPLTEIVDLSSGEKGSGEQDQTGHAGYGRPDVPSTEIVDTNMTVSEADQTVSLKDGAGARMLISAIESGKETLSLDQVFERAREFWQDGREMDTRLLYFYAAREGHGASAFELGTMNDPAYFSANGDMLNKPNLVQAHKWYSIATAHGVADAKERLLILRNHIETAASAGDPGAQRLLLNWR